MQAERRKGTKKDNFKGWYKISYLGRAVLEIYYNTKNRGKLEREVKKFL
jgi:hypothetical protein